MKKLKKYKGLLFNRINLDLSGEKVRFNLFDELKISEVAIDREIKEQPSYYGLISMATGIIRTQFFQAKEDRKAEYSKLYLKAKRRATNGRPYSDEMAKAWVETQKSYRDITNRCIKLKDDLDKLYAASRAFEQRAQMLQTLSSNLRNQK